MWKPEFPRPSGLIAHCSLLLALLGGCTYQTGLEHGMEDQPRVNPMESSGFFDDGRSARPVPEGTVARGLAREDEALHTGRRNGRYVTAVPFPVTRQVLERGRERFNIFCAACHDRVGTGNGMVVQRGFSQPPSYHTDRLRGAPVGHFYDVITNGYGAMFSHKDRIPVKDRWAIAAYIRALQLSQNARPEDLPSSERPALEGR